MARELVTLHIYASTSHWDAGAITVSNTDYRDIPACMRDITYLGSQSVTLSWADIDIKQAQIETLERQLNDERAGSQIKVNALLDQISKLKAIGHEVSE